MTGHPGNLTGSQRLGSSWSDVADREDEVLKSNHGAGAMHGERKVSPRESVGSERSLSLTLGDNFSFPHAWEPEAATHGMTHGANLASGQATFDAFSQTTTQR